MEVYLTTLCLLLVVSVCLGVGLGMFLGRNKSTSLDRVEFEGRYKCERIQGARGRERRDRYDLNPLTGPEGDVVFFMSKSGTKVHLTDQCGGLRGADFDKISMIALCKTCQREKKRK